MNKIFKNLPNKTCSLDAFPTWISKECADELTVTPAITLIIIIVVFSLVKCPAS